MTISKKYQDLLVIYMLLMQFHHQKKVFKLIWNLGCRNGFRPFGCGQQAVALDSRNLEWPSGYYAGFKKALSLLGEIFN